MWKSGMSSLLCLSILFSIPSDFRGEKDDNMIIFESYSVTKKICELCSLILDLRELFS